MRDRNDINLVDVTIYDAMMPARFPGRRRRNGPSFMTEAIQSIIGWLQTHITVWVMVGLFGQFLFMMRFVYQWIASERARMSIVPEAFWYFSLGGGLIVLAYAIHKQDIVFIIGQSLGVLIYLRNLYFIWRHRKTGGKA
jgi:lipid-A-disaccharide synthase-like uncharacterized protein